MAKENQIQYRGNSNKKELDTYVRGSNGLYIFQFLTGASHNPRESWINTLIARANGTTPVENGRTIGAYLWNVYKKDENMSYEDFVKGVNKNEIAPLTKTAIYIPGKTPNEVDMNGNLLVATSNSELLEESDGCGNILIDGQTGKVLRAPAPSVIINQVDERTGYYLIEKYIEKTNPKTGNTYTDDKLYNFLDADGKLISSKTFFHRADMGTKLFTPVTRNYYARDGKKVINSYDIYPTGYIYNQGQDFMFLESDISVVLENRYRKSRGLEPINTLDNYHLIQAGKRLKELDEIIQVIGEDYDMGQISDATYQDMMSKFNDEYDKIEEFKQKYATPEDLEILDAYTNSPTKSGDNKLAPSSELVELSDNESGKDM